MIVALLLLAGALACSAAEQTLTGTPTRVRDTAGRAGAGARGRATLAALTRRGSGGVARRRTALRSGEQSHTAL